MLKTIKVSIFCLGIVLFFTTCKKTDPDDGWESCLDCNITSWIGTYTGTAEYKDFVAGNTTTGLPITIVVSEVGDNYLQVYIHIPNYYSATLSGNFVGTYSISFAGSSYSFSGTMQVKDNTLRLIGDSKYYVEKVNELVIEEAVLYETLKQI
ncbi:MAG: hypothetical protein R2750_10535 [Bacteroidales bacterium]